jgi:hypothetical protein
MRSPARVVAVLGLAAALGADGVALAAPPAPREPQNKRSPAMSSDLPRLPSPPDGATPPSEKVVHIDELEGDEVELPDTGLPPDLPPSQWESFVYRDLLGANHYPDSPEGWRRAARSSVDAIRDAAFHFLARHPDARDEALLHAALSHRDGEVRVWAAFALLRLGHAERRTVLEEASRGAPTTSQREPIVAARLLGELGEPSSFAPFLKWMKQSALRAQVVTNVLPFAALHGRPYAPGRNIDIWDFYKKALIECDGSIQSIVLAELRELRRPESVPVLKAYLRKLPTEDLQANAQRLLDELEPPPPPKKRR